MFVPTDSNGQNLPAAMMPMQCAVPSDQLSASGGVNTSLGAPIWNLPVSFGSSLFNILSPAAITNTMAFTGANQSGNDSVVGSTYGFPEGIAAMLDASNLKPLVAHSVAGVNTPSGTGSSSFFPYPAIQRITYQALGDLTSATQPNQSLGSKYSSTTDPVHALGQPHWNALASGIAGYINAKMGKLGTDPGSANFSAVQKKAGSDLVAGMVPPAGLTPTALDLSQNAAMVTMLNSKMPTFGKNGLGMDLAFNAIYNMLQGAYAVCAFEMGGYDYHGTMASSSDSKEAIVGQVCANAIMMSQAMNTPLLIVVTSDGSVHSTGYTTSMGAGVADSNIRWAGDDANYVVAFGMLSAAGSVKPTQLKTQLGFVDPDTGFSDTTTIVGSDKAFTAVATLNWAHLNGLPLTVADPILTRANFSSSVIASMKAQGIVFG